MADVRNKSRQDRLRAALRENLKRRKQQVKGRAVQGSVAGEPQGEPDDVDEATALLDQNRSEKG